MEGVSRTGRIQDPLFRAGLGEAVRRLEAEAKLAATAAEVRLCRRIAQDIRAQAALGAEIAAVAARREN